MKKSTSVGNVREGAETQAFVRAGFRTGAAAVVGLVRSKILALWLAMPVVLAACASGGSAGSPSSLPPVQNMSTSSKMSASSKIKHVVIVVQENRSFNDLFYGFPGADTVTFGRNSKGRKVPLRPIGLETTWDLDHSSQSFFAACNGKGSYPGTKCRMNGFNREYAYCSHGSYPPCPFKNPEYAYVPHEETKPYFDMAHQYVLADRMFASNFDASSFISHQYIIAGQASSAENYPYNKWGCEGGKGDRIWTVTMQRTQGPNIQACFNNTTLGDELDNAGLSWGYYTATIDGDGGIWSAYQAISHIFYGPDWSKDVFTPPTSFFNVFKKGGLRTVSWVAPTDENSDHAGSGSNTGPSWVASVVNAIGESSDWNSTAIFVFWDDYGGWYDHVPPPMVDYDGLGIRIPLLVISPYAKKGYISHTRYEHGSILKYVEDHFGLARLSASDTRANTLEDCFDYNQSPRHFVPIKAPHDEAYFRQQPLDTRIPDPE